MLGAAGCWEDTRYDHLENPLRSQWCQCPDNCLAADQKAWQLGGHPCRPGPGEVQCEEHAVTGPFCVYDLA